MKQLGRHLEESGSELMCCAEVPRLDHQVDQVVSHPLKYLDTRTQMQKNLQIWGASRAREIPQLVGDINNYSFFF